MGSEAPVALAVVLMVIVIVESLETINPSLQDLIIPPSETVILFSIPTIFELYSTFNK